MNDAQLAFQRLISQVRGLVPAVYKPHAEAVAGSILSIEGFSEDMEERLDNFINNENGLLRIGALEFHASEVIKRLDKKHYNQLLENMIYADCIKIMGDDYTAANIEQVMNLLDEDEEDTKEMIAYAISRWQTVLSRSSA